MKYIMPLFICMSSLGGPRDSRELRIIRHNLDRPQLQRQDAFRIPRSGTLPHVFETAHNTVIEIPLNNSEAKVVEKAYQDKKKSCCSKHKTIFLVVGITTGGVISVSVMSTIVALVIHFAG